MMHIIIRVKERERERDGETAFWGFDTCVDTCIVWGECNKLSRSHSHPQWTDSCSVYIQFHFRHLNDSTSYRSILSVYKYLYGGKSNGRSNWSDTREWYIERTRERERKRGLCKCCTLEYLREQDKYTASVACWGNDRQQSSIVNGSGGRERRFLVVDSVDNRSHGFIFRLFSPALCVFTVIVVWEMSSSVEMKVSLTHRDIYFVQVSSCVLSASSVPILRLSSSVTHYLPYVSLSLSLLSR